MCRLPVLFALFAVALAVSPELSIVVTTAADSSVETTWEGTNNTRFTVAKRRVWTGQVATASNCTAFATTVPKSKSVQFHTPTSTCEIFSSDISDLNTAERATDNEYTLFMRIDTTTVDPPSDDSLSGSEIAATIIISIIIVIGIAFCIYLNWGHEEENITAQMEEIEKAEQEMVWILLF